MEVIKHYVVYRFMNRVWLPISAAFSNEAAARRYRESLPLDWETEIREVAGD